MASAFTAAVLPTSVALMMVALPMVAAKDVRLEHQLAPKEVFHRLIRAAGHPAVKLDTCLGQSRFRPCPNTAANQRLNALGLQKACQRAMAASQRVHHLRGNHFALLCLIDFELLGMAEMLEYLTVFISYCDFHDNFPFYK